MVSLLSKHLDLEADFSLESSRGKCIATAGNLLNRIYILPLIIIFNATFFPLLLSFSYLVQVLAELNLQSFELAEPLEYSAC